MMKIKLPLIVTFMFLMMSSTNVFSANQSWTFRVLLDEEIIGEHSFKLTSENNVSHVKIDANFDVYFFFIKAYSYKHTNYEVWNGRCLQSIKSSTNDNGNKLYVEGTTQAGQFSVKTTSEQYMTDGCLSTFSYWDPSFLKSKYLLNSQTGKIMPVRIEKVGEEEVVARNKTMLANHFRLHTDDFMIDLWYSKNSEWLALNSTTSDGAVLRYQLK